MDVPMYWEMDVTIFMYVCIYLCMHEQFICIYVSMSTCCHERLKTVPVKNLHKRH